jgi:hypothetical protein
MLHRPLAALAVLVISAATILSTHPAPSSPADVSIDASSAIGTLPTEIDTQIKYPYVLDRADGTRPLLRALGPRLVRINATADGCCWPGGPGPMIPAGLKAGDWNFGPLDSVVSDINTIGAQTVLNIFEAPEWMWDCSTRAVRDLTFGEFADYMARLVGYYNKGSFVSEDGRTITNPAGTAHRITYWELWNEPNLESIACLPDAAPNITVAQYVVMWNATAARMLAVDDTIKLLGPATDAPDYVSALVSGAERKPDALTFHAYGGWLASQTDQFLFDGLDGIVDSLVRMRSWGIPVWVTELNISAAATDDPAHRPYNAFGAAWGASAFRRLALAGAATVFQYEFAHPTNPIFQMVDPQTGIPRLPYWRDYYLGRLFPPGSVLLPVRTTGDGIEALAVRAPASRSVRVLVINRQVDGPTARGGTGLPATIRVTLGNFGSITHISEWLLNDVTPLASGPVETVLPAADSVTVSFDGYGVAILEFVAATESGALRDAV